MFALALAPARLPLALLSRHFSGSERRVEARRRRDGGSTGAGRGELRAGPALRVQLAPLALAEHGLRERYGAARAGARGMPTIHPLSRHGNILSRCLRTGVRSSLREDPGVFSCKHYGGLCA